MAYRKYKAKPQVINGIRFDSKKEAQRYLVLSDAERRGEITDLQLQVPFILCDEHRAPPTIGPRGGTKKGPIIAHKHVYIADFVYYTHDGKKVVEDVKGVKTAIYKLKRDLLYEKYGIIVKET